MLLNCKSKVFIAKVKSTGKLSFDLPSEAYELGKRLKETEGELLNVLEKYNFRDEEMNIEDRTKYGELNEMKEKLESKIERIAFLRLPKRLKGKVLVYASCNCSLGRLLPNEYDMKLRSLLLVKVKDVVTFEPEEYDKEDIVVAQRNEKVIEKEIEKLGFRRIPNSKYFFLVLS
jgi:hypothetical protein